MPCPIFLSLSFHWLDLVAASFPVLLIMSHKVTKENFQNYFRKGKNGGISISEVTGSVLKRINGDVSFIVILCYVNHAIVLISTYTYTYTLHINRVSP